MADKKKKPSAKKEKIGPDFDAKGMALAMGIPFGAIAAGTGALHYLLGKEEKKQKRARKGRGATVGMGPSKVTTGGGLGAMKQRDRSKPKLLQEGGAVPPKYKGFSKLPEEVQIKMNPQAAKKYKNGGAVMSKRGGSFKGVK